MLKLRKIAVTGSIASGKSTVCRILKDNGAYVVNSDQIAHELLSLDNPTGKKVLEIFGEQIITNQKIDRKKIARIVFHNPEKLKALEEILHPVILQEIQKIYEQEKRKNRYNLFVVEMPLLFELHQADFYDYVICVHANIEACKRRFKELGFEEDDFNQRTSRQMDPIQKCKKSDFTITNDGSLEDLENKVKEIYPELT